MASLRERYIYDGCWLYILLYLRIYAICHARCLWFCHLPLLSYITYAIPPHCFRCLLYYYYWPLFAAITSLLPCHITLVISYIYAVTLPLLFGFHYYFSRHATHAATHNIYGRHITGHAAYCIFIYAFIYAWEYYELLCQRYYAISCLSHYCLLCYYLLEERLLLLPPPSDINV